MRRPGSDEQNLEMSDFLCDFCHGTWTDDRPMVEGHQGACICGKCLTIAYRALAIDDAPTAEPGYTCTLCREERKQPAWQSPAYDAVACLRCVKQSATQLDKDPDFAWEKPG